jgi:adenylosuccinate synthase
MSNRNEIKLINNQDEINVFNEWQKDFKIGEMDYDLLNYSLDVDNIYSEGIKKNLVVTCLDQRPDFKFEYTNLNTRFEKIYNSFSPDSKDFKIL